jgi:6-phospho-beta-glucosidase
VDVQNRGAIPDLPDDLVVEVLCGVDARGGRPIPMAPLGGERGELIQQLGAFSMATAAAATARDRDAALRALALNPLIQESGQAERIGSELLAAHGL